jgi:hypothetical protein
MGSRQRWPQQTERWGEFIRLASGELSWSFSFPDAPIKSSRYNSLDYFSSTTTPATAPLTLTRKIKRGVNYNELPVQGHTSASEGDSNRNQGIYAGLFAGRLERTYATASPRSKLTQVRTRQCSRIDRTTHPVFVPLMCMSGSPNANGLISCGSRFASE